MAVAVEGTLNARDRAVLAHVALRARTNPLDAAGDRGAVVRTVGDVHVLAVDGDHIGLGLAHDTPGITTTR